MQSIGPRDCAQKRVSTVSTVLVYVVLVLGGWGKFDVVKSDGPRDRGAEMLCTLTKRELALL